MENCSSDFPRNWCLWYAFLGKIESHKKKICPRNNSEGPMARTLQATPEQGFYMMSLVIKGKLIFCGAEDKNNFVHCCVCEGERTIIVTNSTTKRQKVCRYLIGFNHSPVPSYVYIHVCTIIINAKVARNGKKGNKVRMQ
jgi:hypothetical protein